MGRSNYTARTLSNNAVCSDCMQGCPARRGFVQDRCFLQFNGLTVGKVESTKNLFRSETNDTFCSWTRVPACQCPMAAIRCYFSNGCRQLGDIETSSGSRMSITKLLVYTLLKLCWAQCQNSAAKQHLPLALNQLCGVVRRTDQVDQVRRVNGVYN